VAGALLAAPAAGASPRCDPIDPARCLLPWPNDFFTKRDPSTPTGRRLDLSADQMPQNASGVPIEPSDYNWSDGFSPGAPIVTKVPGLDTPAAFARTGVVPVTDIARSFDRNQPIVLIDARTHRRQPIWAELDSNASSPANTALLIHPARNLREKTRYIVALRGLRGADGNLLEPSAVFGDYHDRQPTGSAELERRRPQMERIFNDLQKAHIARSNLYLAWDFTVASAHSLASRELTIRNRAFSALGDPNLRDLRPEGDSPRFHVDTVTNFAPCGTDGCQAGEDDDIQRRVQGTVEVPCYLNAVGCPAGSRFDLDSNGLPRRIPGNVYNARFVCNIPRSVTASTPGRVSLYGHGLFGGAEEVNSIARGPIASEHRVVLCAGDEIGMSSGDLGNTATILTDLSRFPTLVDRLQQAMLDFMFLGRAMIHPDGFASNPAFQDAAGHSLLDTRRLFYAGGSQGGIFGGALSAVAPDFTRSALIVPGMNYSLLLTRSIDFAPFSALLYPSYPDELARPLILSLTQTLWDRGDPDGYAWHITGTPYRNTPRHTVLLHMAFGDHQVANVATEVEARTIGARLREPALDPGRSLEVQPFYGIRRIQHTPFHGSALVVWDIGPLRAGGTLGTPPPPNTNTPPSVGVDPHGRTGREAAAQLQFSEFLKLGGAFIDTCDSHPCYAAGWTGP
jgi:hypothetical protein